MVTKVLKVDVRDNEVEELESKLKGVNSQMTKVESESKRADNALKKVGDNGGAISTLDALTGGLATRIRDGAEATKLFNFNLKGTRTALIATGVGAFLVALGAIVAYWDDIVDLITGANNSLESQVGLIETKISLLESEISLLDEHIRLGTEQNRNVQEFVDKKKELVKLQLEELNYQKLSLEEQLAKEASEARRVTFFESLLGRGAQLTAEEQEGLSQIEKQIVETELRALKLQAILEEINNPKAPKEKDPVRGPDQEKSEVLPTSGVTLSELEDLGQQEFDSLALQQNARTRLEEEQAEIRKRIAEQEAISKNESYMLAAHGFATASRLVGRETAAGKAFAIASTLMATYLSAQQAYASQFLPIPTPDSPVRGGIAAGLAVASGLANVAEIVKIQVPGGGGGPSVSSPSVPPAFNVIDSSSENQLNQSLLEQNNEPIEAFVVDKNVTSGQEARRNKIDSSSFG